MNQRQHPRKAFSETQKYLQQHPVHQPSEGVETDFDEIERLHQQRRSEHHRFMFWYRLLTGLGALVFIGYLIFWIFNALG